ncbi:radical SAM/SPASM protein FxsBH, inactivated beta-hydroxylase extension form [Streptomyces sp. NBC_00827]|uniref:radical SAM/SPASM protein FxsBH, inactivated beta-hydroxylase extension form n=1 Tax=Streptomyces sp. NBC_00827 TaxID=2903677 RepID=UPI00386A64DE|nr:radical SAM/SPASM protein FxsB, inactivated metallohydrolase extension form [Streptomyces sp. NBC_00827]
MPYSDATNIQELVLKIHSRCNLACDHCYMYEHADQSWKTRPAVISEETVAQVAKRLSGYAEAQRIDSFSVILHGGEPLLVGPARLRHICEELTRALAPITTLDLRMHTNGMLLRRQHLEIFDEFDLKVSVSLDGDQVANDRHRLDRRGRSSYDRVLRGIDLLRTPEFRHHYVGLLCTVDVTNDPVTVHDALTALDPPRIDYLLPHSTWDNPPPAWPSNLLGSTESKTPYADWLLKIFDRWEEQGRRVPVRTFDSVLSTLRGGPSLTEAMGLAPSDLAVVETDGAFEQADSLKTAYAGAPATGYDVFHHTFEEFAQHPGVRDRQLGIQGVSETCRKCPVLDSCGGGLYAHRYRTGSGFDNPSVFCADLRGFIEGVAERITDRALSPTVHDGEELRYAQQELTRELLATLNDRGTDQDDDWGEVWAALLVLDGDTHCAPHLNTVLTHPYVRTALRRAWGGPADTAHLASLVVAAAVRAGSAVTLSWQQRDTELHLPTLGTLTLPGSGRIEVEVTTDGFRVHHGTGGQDTLSVRPDGENNSPGWRPLTPMGPTLVIDDTDPYRDCYPVPVAPPLDAGERRVFRKRVVRAQELMDERMPGWRSDVNALTVTTVTPLEAGSGLRLGEHGPGALGVAVDLEPEEFLLHLPRLGHLARFTGLRETTDLALAGSGAGRLLEAACEAIGTAACSPPPGERPEARSRADALERARGTLTELSALPERDLTESGAALVEQLWAEWEERAKAHELA